MSLDDFILTCFCWIDDVLPSVVKGKKLRPSGSQPTMSDSEVLTIEIVGTYLGLSQDQELVKFFGRYYSHFFRRCFRSIARPLSDKPPMCGR